MGAARFPGRAAMLKAVGELALAPAPGALIVHDAPQVVVLGSLNMDVAVRVPRAPAAGETLQARSLLASPGGKGANQAVACARQGARVCMVGKVGEDEHGALLRAALHADGIDARHVSTQAGNTGTAFIVVDDQAQNRIVLLPGANAALCPEDAEVASSLFAAGPMLLLQLEVPMATVARAAQLARERGCRVVLNPSPMQPLPASLWPLLDILIANAGEAQALCACPITNVADARQAAMALRRRGPGLVLITLGAEGVVVADGQGCRHFDALAVQAVDTTAAGDTFTGALCAALVAGASTDEAIQTGILAAALCVTRAGAQVSIPNARELVAFKKRVAV